MELGNASTNTPTLTSGTGTTGHFYIVSVAGSTNLDGITDWQVGDWAIFVEAGGTDTWQKIDNTSAITGTGAINKLAKWTGPTTLSTGLVEDDGTTVTIGNSGDLDVTGSADITGDLAWSTSLTDTTNTITITKFVDEADGIAANDNDTSIPTSAAVKDYVDTQVGTIDTLAEVLVNGNVTGGTSIEVSANDDITFTDTSQALFGSSNDLQILHNGTYSELKNLTGHLYLRQQAADSDIEILSDDGTGTGNTVYFRADGGTGQAQLFYYGGIKLNTDTNGVQITGTADVSSQVLVGGADSIFAENNIRFKSAGTAYIDHNTTSQAINFRLSNASALDTTVMVLNSNGSTRLNQYGSGTFTGTATYNLQVDSSGNIIETPGSVIDGSGTTNYVSKWQDPNTLTDSVIYDNGTNVGIGTTTNISSPLTVQTDASANSLSIIGRNNGTSDEAVISFYEYDGTTRNIYIIKEGGDLAFATGTGGSPSERMRIDSSGQVKINTTTNQFGEKLTVNGWIVSSNGTRVALMGQNSDGAIFGSYSNNNVIFRTNNTEKVRIDSSGNVGIGETNPLGKLHVKATDTSSTANSAGNLLVLEDSENGMSILSSTSGAGYILFGDSGDNDIGGILYDHSANAMRFRTNGVWDRMRIDSSGSVQLNSYGSGTKTGTAAYSLSVDSSGNIIETTSTSIGGTGTTNYVTKWLGANTIGDSVIYDDGNVGINNTVASTIDSASGLGTLVVGDGGASSQGITIYTGTATYGALNFADATSGTGAYQGYIKFDHTDNSFGHYIGNVERLHIDSSGNLALQNGAVTLNKSDGVYLDLRHNNSTRGYLGIANQIITGGSTSDLALTATTNLVFGTGGTTERMRITSGGNIGINETNPQYGKLQIKTGSAIGYTPTSFMSGTNLRLTTGGTAGTNITTGVSFGIGGAAEAYIGAVQNSSAYADVVFQTYHGAYGERMRMTSAGNVGINNTNPSYKLDVTGSIKASVQGRFANGSASAPSYSFDADSDIGMYRATTNTLGFSTAGAERFVIDSNGSIYNSNGGGNTWYGSNNAGNPSNVTGTHNASFGYSAGNAVTSGSYNVSIGNFSFDAATTAERNTSVGTFSNSSITTGSYNTSSGYGAGGSLTTGSNNVAVGYVAMNTGSQGAENTAVGAYSMANGTLSGNDNTAVGYYSGAALTSGTSNTLIGANAGDSITSASSNTAVGQVAYSSNATGTGNTAIGRASMQSGASGNYNTGVGNDTLEVATGNYNTAVGYRAGLGIQGVNNNVAIGALSMFANAVTGIQNVAVGTSSLYSLTSGNYNTGVGEGVMAALTSGSYNVAMGRDALSTNAGYSANTAIGYESLKTTNNAGNTAIGFQSGVGVTSGSYNNIIGHEAGSGLTTGSYNVLMGDRAGRILGAGAESVLIGHQTGYSLSNGSYNTCVGFKNLNAATGGHFNTSMGFAALNRYEGDENTAIGAYAAHYATTATRTTAVGMQAGFQISTGDENTMVGFRAGQNINTGEYNVGLGSLAMLASTTATFNVALGRTALYQLTTGTSNIGIGYDAFQAITTNSYNTGVGGSVGTFQTGSYNTSMGYFSNYGVSGGSTGSYNTTMGYYAGYGNRGENNTFLGALAGRFNSTGTRNTIVGSQAADNATITGSHNTALGFGAAHNISSGVHNVSIGDSSFFTGNANYNIAIGSETLYYTTGASNVAIGHQAGHSNTSGASNNYIGYQAGKDGTTCTDNNFMGYNAGENVTTGSSNIGIGTAVFQSLTTSSGNIAFGFAALGGATMTGTGRNIAIGDAAGYNVSNGQNNILIGWNAGRTGSQSPQSMGGVASGSNQIHIGNESHTNALVQVSWTVNSDARDKTDVKDLDLGLDFIDSLRPVTYRWDKRSQYEDRKPTGEHKESKLEVGLIAQEVIEQENKAGYNFEDETNLFSWESEDKNKVGLQYEKLVPALINSIKELKQEIENLKSQINN